MMPLSEQLEEAGLSRVATRLLALSRWGARLERVPVDEDEVPRGMSRLGGAPEAAAGTEWPRRGGRPLTFVAQLDLSELVGLPGLHELPPTGLLSFFYDNRTQPRGLDRTDVDAGRVVYTGGETTALEPLAPPPDAEEAGHFPACLLVAHPTVTLPPVGARAVVALELDGPELNAYYDLLLAQSPTKSHGTLHQLMGHPAVFGGDLALLCQLASNGVACRLPGALESSRAQELAPGADAWRLLLQVDSDERADMQWGSDGRLYFWIQETRLAERDFGGAWAILQSS